MRLSKAKRFNEIVMQQGHSIPFQVREHLKMRRSWEQGLTCEQLCDMVKFSIVRFAKINLSNDKKKAIKKKKVSKGTIYSAVSKINLFSEPPFYIMNSVGYLDNGKKEHRYFIPKEDKHYFEVEKKNTDIILRTKQKESNLEEYKKVEQPMEIKHKNIVQTRY